MSCSMRIEYKLFEEKKIQLQSMSNVMICMDKRFAVKNSGISKQLSFSEMDMLQYLWYFWACVADSRRNPEPAF